MILAEKIMQLRKQRGWSQEELADKLGISRQSVSKWESGMSIPDLDKILKLGGVFGVSTDYLLKEDLEECEQAGVAVPGQFDEPEAESVRSISMQEAETYMDLTQKVSKRIAFGVLLCILSPICLIQLGAVSEYKGGLSENAAGGLGMIILLGMVVIAVAIFILNGMRFSRYEYMEKEIFSLQYGVKSMVERRKQMQEDSFRLHITVGVCICIVAIIPLFVGTMMEVGDFGLVTCVSILLVFVAIGVFVMVSSGMVRESYDKLLQMGDYTPEKKEIGRRTSYVAPVYWCIVVAIYLLVSFRTENWRETWIIWPVAGVLFAAVYGIVRAFAYARRGRR